MSNYYLEKFESILFLFGSLLITIASALTFDINNLSSYFFLAGSSCFTIKAIIILTKKKNEIYNLI